MLDLRTYFFGTLLDIILKLIIQHWISINKRRLIKHISLIWKKQWFFYKYFSDWFCTFIWYLINWFWNILNWIWIIILSHKCIIIIIERYNMPIVFLKWIIFIFDFFPWIIYLHNFLAFKRSDRFLINNLIRLTFVFCINFMLNKIFFLFSLTKKALILDINIIFLTFS